MIARIEIKEYSNIRTLVLEKFSEHTIEPTRPDHVYISLKNKDDMPLVIDAADLYNAIGVMYRFNPVER